MFQKFRQVFQRREKTTFIRIFETDKLKVVELQKKIARDLDLVNVSQSQIIRYLLEFQETSIKRSVK
jgi:hypothetical protein